MKIAFAGVQALPNLVFWHHVFPQLANTPKVILSSNLVLGRSPAKSWKRFHTLLTRSGLHYLTYILSLSLRPKQTLSDDYLDFKQLFRQHQVELLHAGNFNHPATIRALEDREVTHVVSHYCDQIFQPAFLEASFETLNLHPSLLPDYRGVDPLFQQLLAGNEAFGVTLHEVNPKIDAGPIINQQAFAGPFHTHLQALIRAAETAAELLARWVENPEACALRPQPHPPHTPYHSWPTKEQIRRLEHKGLRLS